MTIHPTRLIIHHQGDTIWATTHPQILVVKARHYPKNIGIAAYPHDPSVYMCSLTRGGPTIYVGLYLDHFVYFRKYDVV